MDTKFYVDTINLYMVGQPKERTRERLVRIAESGFELVGNGEFGLRGIVSGLFIEKVWHYSDEAFNDYLNWMISVKGEKKCR
jgi:hypothetical protein